MKIIYALTLCLLSALTANAQFNYTGGTYTQNFNTLSQNTVVPGALPPLTTTTTNPFNDNTTLTGWYANRNVYTTAPDLLLGLAVTNQLTSTGTGSDRSLGSYLGLVAVLDPVVFGLQLRNNTGAALTSFTLAFTAEEGNFGLGAIAGVSVLDSFNLSYSTNASDVSGAGATNYQTIGSSPNLLNLSILGNSTDSTRVQLTITGINVANGSDLWIRWDRTGLLGITDNALSIDDVSVTAVPEPTTYILIGLGLGALFLCKKLQGPAVKKSTTSSGRGKAALLAVVLSLGSLLTLPAQSTFSLKTDSDNNLFFQADGQEKMVPRQALREPFSGSWGSCVISRGRDADGQNVVIVSMAPNSKNSSFLFNGATIKGSSSKPTVLYPQGPGEAPKLDIPTVALAEVVVSGSQIAAQSVPPNAPVYQRCKYVAQKDSMILQDDFDWAYADSLQKKEVLVVDSNKCLKTIDNYFVAMNQSPPPSIWIRNESFLQRSPSAAGAPVTAGNVHSLVPVTRPDQLMPVLKASDLFDNMTVEQYRNTFYNMLPEMEQTSQQISDLLKKWDQGQITVEEMKVVQSASKVVWLVRCNLVTENIPGADSLARQLTQQVNLSLNPEATTPF